MEVVAELEWDDKTYKSLQHLPDDTLYAVAKQTLDRSIPYIPMSNLVNHAGTLRRSSSAGGVRGTKGDYYIGSYTSYASSVWRMPEGTNWTTPETNNKWFARTLNMFGKNILDSAINKSWKDNM